MHLLAAQAGAIQQDGEAIDLGQTPGDIVFASSADSELALLAGAADRAGETGLRLANLLRLSHNLSVDLWLDNTVRHARLVVVRLLGGAAYWQYGVDELTALAARGVRVALFPGEAQPDAILRQRSTIDPEDWDKLFALLVAGGAENADAALTGMRAVAAGEDIDTSPALLPRFGAWATPALPAGIPPLKGEGMMRQGGAHGRPSPLRGGWRQPGGGTLNARHARPEKNIARARTMRRDATPAEHTLWKALRHFAPLGYHFRRQVPIGRYFADFACHHPKLVVELDGDTHAGAESYDRQRDAFLRKAGYQVIRFGNRDVRHNLEGVIASIRTLLEDLRARPTPTRLPPPSPQGGGAQIGAAVPSRSLPLEGLRGDKKSLQWSDFPEKASVEAGDAGRQGGGKVPPPLGSSPEQSTTPPPPSLPLEGLRGDKKSLQRSDFPEKASAEAGDAGRQGGGATPTIPILFYRALLDGAGTAVVDALTDALAVRNLAPLPLFVSSLKEPEAVAFLRQTFTENPPAAILNLTGFALGLDGLPPEQNPFAATDAPVIQLVQGGRPAALWAADMQGLAAKDLAMQVVMPELDGRIGGILIGHKAEAVWHARTQCPLSAFAPEPDGIARAADLAANWVRLRNTPRPERRVGIVLANYPIRDGRLANGVGYDAPASTAEILRVLAEARYEVGTPTLPAGIPSLKGEGVTRHRHTTYRPSPLRGGWRQPGGGTDLPTGAALIDLLQSGPTNANPNRPGGIAFLLARYRELLATLPEKLAAEVTARWGEPEADPFVRDGAFHLPAIRLGNVAILLQPSRGYDRDDAASYHDPDLVPPHAYLAAYLWLRNDFAAHAVIHNGKHGNLEWLPGKAVALDAASYPAALWGGLPHLYPFIVNDPGEGTQAKRRTGAVIIDHLVPPLTRAETYGPLKDLEALLDEYYAASGLDRRRLADLRRRILGFARDARLDADVKLPEDEAEALKTLDNFLCDLKEAQIRDGLHVFGRSPEGRLARDLTVALARVPRGEGAGEASLIRALADDLKLGFDPLTAKLGEPWTGPVPDFTESFTSPSHVSPLRTIGDMVEALEAVAAALVEKAAPCLPEWTATRAVLATVDTVIRPRLSASGPNEIKALLDGLDGKFVAPGPSGAPSRGRLDVLPTGRNFYSLDNRAVPTPTAWELGKKSAENLLLRHLQDHGSHMKSLVLSVWGTSNMRTGGDDIAQALAFIGARPVWDPGSLRLSGYEIIPLARLGRPRVDVTLRISGFFRDAFPAQIALFDRAVRAVGALDEPEDDNPLAARMRTEALGLMADGVSEAEAARQAGYRIFGSKPGAYGAGLQGLMDSGKWSGKADLAEAFLNWGQYAYGARDAGTPDRARFAARLSGIEAVVQNQDNREHDLLDSDDYYQFEGGLVATAETLSGTRPAAYHNDHSRPERPLARTLEEEISKVVRSRVVNPKWIDGVKRHGYKGAFEIIATVDYMFAFAATTGAVRPHHFDLAFAAFVEDDATRQFIIENNRFGYDELIAKFNEARARGLWTPRSNAAHIWLEKTE